MKSNRITRAMEDLAFVRTALETYQKSAMTKSQVYAGLFINGFLSIVVGILLTIEIVHNNQISQYLQVIRYDESLRIFTIGYIFGLVGLFVAMAYLLLGKLARSSQQSVTQFLNQNFSFMANLSLVSDLFLKLIFLSVLIVLNKVEWVTPLLLLFASDFLIQGRVFRFSLKTSFAMALTALFLAVVAALLNIQSLLLPLSFSLVLSAGTTANLLKLRGAK